MGIRGRKFGQAAVYGAALASVPFGLSWISPVSSSTTAGATFTFNAQNTGTADPTRLVVVGVSGDIASVTVSSVTINGSNATHISGSSVTNATVDLVDWWYLAVPSGTTANIVVNFSASETRAAISVYRVVGTGASPGTPATTTISAAATITTAATIPVGGGAAAMVTIHNASIGAVTPTNLTTDANVVYGTSTVLSGSNTSSSGSTTMGFTWVAGTSAVLSIVPFNP